MIDSDLLPNFGIIEDIIIDDLHSYYFVIEKLHTICISSHYHSYEVIKHSPTLFHVCKLSDLWDHSVLGLYQIPHNQSYFVPLKYYLIENV